MKSHRITARLAAAALAGGLVVGGAGAAQAAPGDRIDAVKHRAHTAVEHRLDTLTKLRQRVTDDAHLTDADRTELLAEIDADSTGLTALDQKIQADTDKDTLKADVHAIVLDYRVYLLMVPK